MHPSASSCPRKRRKEQANGEPALEWSVASLSLALPEYDVQTPWRAGDVRRGSCSGWFFRAPWQDDSEPTRYIMTCNHCIVGSAKGVFVQVRTPAMTGEASHARLVVAMPE